MQQYRIREQVEGVIWPSPSSRPVMPTGFLVCLAILGEGWSGEASGARQQIYRTAFERALAVVQPTRMERLMACEWN
jgi:hypothetical protein